MKKLFIIPILILSFMSCKSESVLDFTDDQEQGVLPPDGSGNQQGEPSNPSYIPPTGHDFFDPPLNSYAAPVFPGKSINLSFNKLIEESSVSMLGREISFSDGRLLLTSNEKVFIYEENNGNFALMQTIDEETNNAQIYKDTLVLIVQSTIPNIYSGLIYGNALMAKVYKLEGGQYIEKAILTHDDPRDADIFGFDLKINDNYIIISTPLKDAPIDCTGELANTNVCKYSFDLGTDEGAIYVFDKDNYELLDTYWGESVNDSIGARLILNDNKLGAMNLEVDLATYLNIETGEFFSENTYISNIGKIDTCMYRGQFIDNKVYLRPILKDKMPCAFFNINFDSINYESFNFAFDKYTFTLVTKGNIMIKDFYSQVLADEKTDMNEIRTVVNEDNKLFISADNKVFIYDLNLVN